MEGVYKEEIQEPLSSQETLGKSHIAGLGMTQGT